MTSLNQWHDQDGTFRFHSQSLVYFSQCNRTGRLSFNELLKLTSDVAVEDFNQRGMDRSRMFEAGFMILVSRAAFKIHRSPKENEQIELSTWEEKSEPLQFVRMYEIRNSSTGEKLVTGESKWLLADSKSRRLLPIKKYTLRTPVDTQTEHDCMKADKIEMPQDMELIGRRTVRYSDIDANGHTNNARYGAFVMDALPPEYQDLEFTDYRINYSREAMLGEELQILAKYDDEARKITVAGKTSEGISFECELYY